MVAPYGKLSNGIVVMFVLDHYIIKYLTKNLSAFSGSLGVVRVVL